MKSYFKVIIAIVLSMFFYIGLFYSDTLEYLNYKVYDTFETIDKKINDKKYNSSVTVIDIDEKSLNTIGQWPWSRIILSELIKKVDESHPSSIGIDILFSEKDKTSPIELTKFYSKFLSQKIKIEGLSKNLFDNDLILANQIRASKVILPIYLNSNTIENTSSCTPKVKHFEVSNNFNNNLKAKGIICNIQPLQNSAYNTGFINSSSDKDGIFRRLPLFINYEDKLVPSFALANLMKIDDLKVKKDKFYILDKQIKMDYDSNVLLKFHKNYFGDKISAIDILRGKFDKSLITGKIVIVGSSAIALHDFYKITDNETISGIDIQATLINNVINGDLKYELNSFKNINLFIAFIFSLVILYIFMYSKYHKLLFVFLFIIFYFMLNISLFAHNIYFSFAYFIVPFIVYYFFLHIYLLVTYYTNKQKYQKDILQAHSNTIDSMVAMIETNDLETGHHIKRTKSYAYTLSKYLYDNNFYKDIIDEEFLDLIYKSSPLHDIGKIGVPDNILKKPGKLTEEEFDIMKTHSTIGKNILQNSMNKYEENKFLKMAYNIAYNHHERWDGKGYPRGLKKEEIPLEARIMAICDVYDALINKRCYKESYSFEKSEELIISLKGIAFEPVLVDTFIELKDTFRKIAHEYSD